MSVDSLREHMDMELLYEGLGGRSLRPGQWGIGERFTGDVPKHLPLGCVLRVSRELMPAWYVQLWWDPTQLDGRVELVECSIVSVRVRAAHPSLPDGVMYTISLETLLHGIRLGNVADAQ